MKKSTLYLALIILSCGIFILAIDTLTASPPSSEMAGCAVITSQKSGYIGQADFGCEELQWDPIEQEYVWVLVQVFSNGCVSQASATCTEGYCNDYLEWCRTVYSDPNK